MGLRPGAAWLGLVTVLLPSLVAQDVRRPIQVFPYPLQQHLELSNEQVRRIVAANADFRLLVAGKAARLREVQAEIAARTGESPLDPSALGARHAEAEAIRRELTAAQDRLREQVRAELTEPQRAKLAALEEAQRLLPLITQAQGQNFLPGPLELDCPPVTPASGLRPTCSLPPEPSRGLPAR
jgi:hypothetical protein